MFSVVKMPADKSRDEETAAEFVIKLFAAASISSSGSGHEESVECCLLCVFLLCRLELREATGANASVAWG